MSAGGEPELEVVTRRGTGVRHFRSLPEIDGLSKETVLTSWMAKFDCILKGTGDEDSKRPSRMQQPLNSELILSKEQLYDMFQQILGVKKFEHQILFNALMVSASHHGRGQSHSARLFSVCSWIRPTSRRRPFAGSWTAACSGSARWRRIES